MKKQDAMDAVAEALGRYCDECRSIIASIDDVPTVSAVPEYMNYQQAAAYIGISVTSLYQKKGHGKIDFEIVGTRVLFRRSVLDAWIKDNPVMSESLLLDAVNRVKGGVI